MGWREEFSRLTGPGMILGITLGDLIRLLSQNRFQVPLRYWSKAAFAGCASLITTPLRHLEESAYSRRLAMQPVLPPIFIIGHWRSGTTHLHNLLAVDPRFAYANFSQISIPYAFLIGEPLMAAGSAFFLSPDRMGIDNVALNPRVPYEEEFALCLMTFRSPYMSWVFPHRADYYDRYLTFRGIPGDEVECWKTAFVKLLTKLSLKYQRAMLLKSPPNTARIKLILEMFPDARFVHIHRDPYVVYQSTQHLHQKCMDHFSLQRPDPTTLHRRVMRQYSEMFEAYFGEKSLIPEGRFCELAYSNLEADPVREVRQIYERLGLADFSVVEPAVKKYAGSLAGYKKNCHVELTPEVRAEIRQAWQRSFDEWKYPRHPSPTTLARSA
jgi:hypothetical protein